MDGRTARAARNRQAVIDATLALMEEGVLRPTAQAVAERAGVAIRSVFHYFADVETLHTDAAETQAQRHWSLLTQPVTGELAERVEQVVALRARLFERIGGTRRAALLLEHESPVFAERLTRSRAALRAHLSMIVPELGGLEPPSREAACAAASWETWQVLRRDQGLSVDAAVAAVVAALKSLLAVAPSAPPGAGGGARER
ncbi:TetR/AcrR family transcriptional regulator [Nocardia sp. NEAU-G5]|uniref:TetR/AcrR family transcriptional regulator n=1 Tax=Nocardia albiluteola TaxID=2842303 RepID=A0ABS6AXQ4_9NOCA|nr:TetR/AcrR family transcriptional regulator [Nocardia albiluteola]MBU3062296.1 TetR/AcrR family transcriptional regulator [Nocardia albiluteola]